MNTLLVKIWLIFAIISVTAVGLAVTIADNGKKANQATQDLVSVQLPKFTMIKELRAAIAENELLIYEYYSTTNREVIWPKIRNINNNIIGYIDLIVNRFGAQINELSSLYSEIQNVSRTLDINLSKQPVDWDRARVELTRITVLREKTEVILIHLTKSTQETARQGAESAKIKIQNIIYLVLAFTVIIITSALFIGYYSQVNIRKSAKGKALAQFPERNPNPVINLAWNGEILFGNPASKKLLNSINPNTEKLEELLPIDFFNDLKKLQKNNQTQYDFEADINDRHFHYNLSLMPDLGTCHLYIEDATERKKAQVQLKYQALHDVHTGMPNRRQFESNLTTRIDRSIYCSALFISIDRFKFITSSQGYNIGDLIIKSMGKRLLSLSEQQIDQIQSYRLEGSTFCLLIETQCQDTALEIAVIIQNAMDEPLCVNDHRYYLNVSMGISHFPQDGSNAQEIITNGNAALNNARSKGDSCVSYSLALHSEEQSWLPIDAGMRQALEKNEFVMYYQAKVDTQSTVVKGAEALIRWKKTDGSILSPGIFIPVAEQTGLIIKIGQWVIEEACKQANIFKQNNQDIQLAINISARQFQHRHFLDNLKQTLADTKADPSKIELEITESLIMENADQSIRIMKKLKDMGFALAIDDFGTGYSSLSYLKKFPIDTLKVDQTFVHNLEQDSNDQSIVRAIIDLAKHLNLKTVAEGVETEAQWRFLKSLECDFIQGYLFSKPDLPSKLIK
ncbi:MAG: diguanylate cyclase (GGDEF)-like protein [Bermanella sp.]